MQENDRYGNDRSRFYCILSLAVYVAKNIDVFTINSDIHSTLDINPASTFHY